MSQLVYDVETYPNCFIFCAVHSFSNARVRFECSDFRDDSAEMFEFFRMCAREQVEWVGYNNLGFDYIVVHDLVRWHQSSTAREIAKAAYDKAQAIIDSRDRFAFNIWKDDRFVPQVDLYKVNHFDNPAKATSLKALQFTMRVDSVEDLPIAPGTIVTDEQALQLGDYCLHDCDETKRFLQRCAPEIEFRRALTAELDGDVMNWSDVKIGAEYMISRLGKQHCYTRDANNQRKPRQTERSSIPLGGIIFPYIKFNRPDCRELLERFRGTVVTNTKAGVADSVELDGFAFHFGTGGVHGSADKRAFHARDGRVIIDADVTSLYPNIAVQNGLFPEHLGTRYVAIYGGMLSERQRYAKGTPRNAMYKLAANGTYGNSNNPWSCFYDPQYTMATTINGQLMLLMLAERLLDSVPGLQIIQINTDGVTCSLPGASRPKYEAICATWQHDTRLSLEFAEFSSFYCRDVNNYLAVKLDGKVKRKGAYDYPEKDDDYNGWWHRDYSGLVIQHAAESALLGRGTVGDFVERHSNAFDFMCRYKTPKGSKLMLGDDQQQRLTRFYHATDGLPLIKESPPKDGCTPGAWKRRNGIDDHEFRTVLRSIPAGSWDARIHTANRSVYADRTIRVAGAAAACNRAADFDWTRVDRAWYIAEARKLVDCFSAPKEVSTDGDKVPSV